MKKYLRQYQAHWKKLVGDEKRFEKAVGGDFEAVGILEASLLKSLGLRRSDTVVDVGCGSGRLAVQLSQWLEGHYVGTDILPPLLKHARTLCGRPEWRFEATAGQRIPAADDCADMICFFSVMTHITHEETWNYILESKRVLKAGGKIVCSFLEFLMETHWPVFAASYADKSRDKVSNQFMSRDAFQAFAAHADLEVEAFFDGDKPHIPLDREIIWENGIRMSGSGNLGQSICVLRKPTGDGQ